MFFYMMCLLGGGLDKTVESLQTEHSLTILPKPIMSHHESSSH